MVFFLRQPNVLERQPNPRRQLHVGSSHCWLWAYALVATTIVVLHETRNLVSFISQQDEQEKNSAEASMVQMMMLPIVTPPSQPTTDHPTDTGTAAAASTTSTTTTTTTTNGAAAAGWDPLNPLAIPAGQAQNLPSIRVETNKDDDEQQSSSSSSSLVVDDRRKFYGGAGDQKHLGGFTDIDLHGISPAVWKHMIQVYGIHSVLDVGCGRGISTLWFLQHGLDQTLCVEGSHDAVQKSVIPPQHVVEHDFSRGPWWPANTYDAVWSVEFLEHVGVQYQFNYLTAFRKAALIFVTTSRNGGWHHTEVHDDAWWIRKYQAYGFVYSPELTLEVRNVARLEKRQNEMAPNGGQYNAQHVWLTMKVFVNPVVAALPQHAHLFPEHGCFARMDQDRKRVNRICGTGRGGDLETPLPKTFHPLLLTPEMDQAWQEQVRKHVKQVNATTART